GGLVAAVSRADGKCRRVDRNRQLARAAQQARSRPQRAADRGRGPRAAQAALEEDPQMRRAAGAARSASAARAAHPSQETALCDRILQNGIWREKAGETPPGLSVGLEAIAGMPR